MSVDCRREPWPSPAKVRYLSRHPVPGQSTGEGFRLGRRAHDVVQSLEEQQRYVYPVHLMDRGPGTVEVRTLFRAYQRVQIVRLEVVSLPRTE